MIYKSACKVQFDFEGQLQPLYVSQRWFQKPGRGTVFSLPNIFRTFWKFKWWIKKLSWHTVLYFHWGPLRILPHFLHTPWPCGWWCFSPHWCVHIQRTNQKNKQKTPIWVTEMAKVNRDTPQKSINVFNIHSDSSTKHRTLLSRPVYVLISCCIIRPVPVWLPHACCQKQEQTPQNQK